MVFLVTVVPFVELRGAIPLAIGVGFEPAFAFVTCVLFNLLVIPLAFVLLDFVLPPIRRKVKLVDRLFRWSVERARKHQNLSLIGLAMFVGIPLPVTGAYTGSLIAYIAGLDRRSAALAIGVGVAIAGVLIWIFTTLGITLIRLPR